jgi:hypothetical protein
VLENRTNGENLPVLVEGLLVKVLRGELKLDQQDDVMVEATRILNAA